MAPELFEALLIFLVVQIIKAGGWLFLFRRSLGIGDLEISLVEWLVALLLTFLDLSKDLLKPMVFTRLCMLLNFARLIL